MLPSARVAILSMLLLTLCVACTEPGPVSGRVVSLKEDDKGDMRITIVVTNEGEVATDITCDLDLPDPGHDFRFGATTVLPGKTREGEMRLEELKSGEVDVDDIMIACEPDDMDGPVGRF